MDWNFRKYLMARYHNKVRAMLVQAFKKRPSSLLQYWRPIVQKLTEKYLYNPFEMIHYHFRSRWWVTRLLAVQSRRKLELDKQNVWIAIPATSALAAKAQPQPPPASSATTIALISLCRSAHCSDLSKSYSMRAASGAHILPFCNCGSTNWAQSRILHDKGDLMQWTQ